MEHGTVLYKLDWDYIHSNRVYIYFRYRFDPIPGIHGYRRWFYCWYKRQKTTNEKRQWYMSEGYGRLKRNPNNLPDTNDDRQRSDVRNRKSWKKCRKVKKQWQKNL